MKSRSVKGCDLGWTVFAVVFCADIWFERAMAAFGAPDPFD